MHVLCTLDLTGNYETPIQNREVLLELFNLSFFVFFFLRRVIPELLESIWLRLRQAQGQTVFQRSEAQLLQLSDETLTAKRDDLIEYTNRLRCVCVCVSAPFCEHYWLLKLHISVCVVCCLLEDTSFNKKGELEGRCEAPSNLVQEKVWRGRYYAIHINIPNRWYTRTPSQLR